MSAPGSPVSLTPRDGLASRLIVPAAEIEPEQLEFTGELWILLGLFQPLYKKCDQNCHQQRQKRAAQNNEGAKRARLPLRGHALVQLLYDQSISGFIYFCCF